MRSTAAEKASAIVALLITLAVVAFVPNRPLVAVLLVVAWWGVFRPLAAAEVILFWFAASFFVFQNYVTLKAGLFEFRFKDVLLQPYYEPFLWGFYFLSLKRVVDGRLLQFEKVEAKAVVAVVITSMAFSIFGSDATLLLKATLASTALLFILFHEPRDIAYAGCALALGFVIELFGVSRGLWWYPASDFLGIPFWFATMWVCVGLLGGRFLIPVSGWLARRPGLHRA